MTSARKIQTAISAAATALAGAHLIFPALSIDAITLTLFATAVLPWLAPLFRSVELPGGIKVEFQELEKAAQKAEEAGLIPDATPDRAVSPTYSFETVTTADPILALAGLRVELERTLKQIAQRRDLPSANSVSASRVTEYLTRNGFLKDSESDVIRDLLTILNRAVHGAPIDPDTTDWALTLGRQILDELTQRDQPPSIGTPR